VPFPSCDAVITQLLVPPALAVNVTVLPEVLVPDPVQPPPDVAIVTANPDVAVAETVKVEPNVWFPGEVKEIL